MAYDEGLAERIRGVLDEARGVVEKKMFGGLCFLRGGKMFVGIVKHDLMVRVGPERYMESLALPHARPMDFTGRPMQGYVYVAPEGTCEDADLARWVRLGVEFAATLVEPSRAPAPKRRARRPKRR
jgi:TfoX/Sxy family transcriptional regulator of competence genes